MKPTVRCVERPERFCLSPHLADIIFGHFVHRSRRIGNFLWSAGERENRLPSILTFSVPLAPIKSPIVGGGCFAVFVHDCVCCIRYSLGQHSEIGNTDETVTVPNLCI